MTDGTAQDGVPWRSFLAAASRLLGSEIDARRIVEVAAGLEPAEFHAGLDQLATERGVAHFDAMVERRRSGEPLQYVLGSWSFRTLDLLVDRRVLIPRPETESVAGVAIDELRRLRGTRLADLGTGSGAIGLSVLAEVDDVEVVLTDRSADALAVARGNLVALGSRARLARIAEGSWFGALNDHDRGRIDVIVSNPPYVATGDDLPAEVADWEPTAALLSGPDGLDDARTLIAEAGEWLTEVGSLVMELSPMNVATAAELADAAGFSDIDVLPDLSGRDRTLRARMAR